MELPADLQSSVKAKKLPEIIRGNNLELRTENFPQAIHMIEQLENIRKTKRDKSQNNGNELSSGHEINLIVDIDGVLIHTKQAVIEFVGLLLGGQLNKAFQKCRERIPREYLKVLLKMRKHGEVILLSDRLRWGINFFPSLGGDARTTFRKHQVQVHEGRLKIFLKGEELIHLVRNCRTAYYIGSSQRDRKLSHKMREKMKQEGMPNERLIFIQVPHHFF